MRRVHGLLVVELNLAGWLILWGSLLLEVENWLRGLRVLMVEKLILLVILLVMGVELIDGDVVVGGDGVDCDVGDGEGRPVNVLCAKRVDQRGRGWIVCVISDHFIETNEVFS